MAALSSFLQIFSHSRSLRDQFLRNLIGLFVLAGIIVGMGLMLKERAQNVLTLRTEVLEKELEAGLVLRIRERFGATLPSLEAIEMLIPNVDDDVLYLEMLQAAGTEAFSKEVKLFADTATSEELGNGIRAVPFTMNATGGQDAGARLLKNLGELPMLVAVTSYTMTLQAGEGSFIIAVSGFVYLRVPASN